jgi:hypothetical protein
VNSLLLPTLCVAVIATFIAQMFFEVFGMGTTSELLAHRTPPRPRPIVVLLLSSALLQCFVADEEMSKGDPDKAYAEGPLRAYLTAHAKRKKKRRKIQGKKSVQIRASSMRETSKSPS